nr:hypothetical protein [Blunervirus sp.]
MDVTSLAATRFVAVQLLAVSSVLWNDVLKERPPTNLPGGLLPANSAAVYEDLVSRFAAAASGGAAQPPGVLSPAVTSAAGVTAPPVPASQVPSPAVNAVVPPVAPAPGVAPLPPPAHTPAPAAPAVAAPPPPAAAVAAKVPVGPAAPAPPHAPSPARHKRDVAAVADTVADVLGDVVGATAEKVGEAAVIVDAAAGAVGAAVADTPDAAVVRNRRSIGDAVAEVAETVETVAGHCSGNHLPGRLCAAVGSVADSVENTVQSDERAFTKALF